ncbi:MAG TPA: cytochrome c oxidase subunit 3 [Anaerolineales bacterium]|nr:cytochrome c oxidase subunit 3 [Anaerolineales bacterium]
MTTEILPLEDYRKKSATNRLGLWLFILSDIFLFGGLYVSRFYLLGTAQRPDVSQVLGVGVTAMLLVSSFFMNRAETAIRFGDQKTFLRSTFMTLVLGVLFLVGVVGVEWQIAPGGPADGVAWSLFYAMTGYHALHVLSGVIFLFVVYRNGQNGMYSAERHWQVEAAAVYWHFVDVAWIFFYPALYLIGTPVI